MLLGSLRKVTDWDTTGAGVYFGESPRLKTIELDSLQTVSSIGFNLLESIQRISVPALSTASSFAASDNLRLGDDGDCREPDAPRVPGPELAARVLERSGDNPNLISRFNLADECANQQLSAD